MVQDLPKIQILGDWLLEFTEQYYPYVNAIFRLQSLIGCRFGDARLYKDWAYNPDADVICFQQQKTGQQLCTDWFSIPEDIRNATPQFKEKMALQSSSKVNKLARRNSCPVVRSVNGTFTITHVFRYIFIYEKKELGLTNQKIANQLGIAVGTLNHYLAREFEFLN